MKAFETRKASVQPQYDSAMEDIKRAMERGWKSAHVGHGTLYPEVAEMIAKDGFDIKIVKRANDFMSYNEVSWENAEEGKVGNITYVDETQPKPDPTNFLIGILGLKKEESNEPEEDEEKTKKESETDSKTEE